MEMDPERARAVFQTWLRALGEDPHAALAASLAYAELSAEGREAWLDAIDEDAKGIPPMAVYAPLLAVEEDAKRRSRILSSLRDVALPRVSPETIRAWHGDHAAVIVAPVYLELVEMLGASWNDDGFVELVHVPLARADDPLPDLAAELTPAPPIDVVEELALVVLAHDRSGKPRPEGAHALVRYLTPCIS
jgi:hypothetical protein